MTESAAVAGGDGERRFSHFGYSLRALKNRNFAIFWSAAFITNAGGWFQSLAVPYVIYLITGSALWVGLAAVGQFLPVLLVGPLAGVLAERGNLRLTLFITQLIRALMALGFLAVWVSGWHEPLVLLALITATGFAQGMSMPSWQSFIARLSSRENLSSAAMLNTIQFNLARSLGPAAGGVILLLWGPAWAFLLTFIAVMCVVVAVAIIRDPTAAARAAAPRPPKQGVARQFADSLHYSGTQPGIVMALLVIVLVGTLGMPIFQHVIVFSESVFSSGAYGLAVLNLALGVGTLIAVPIVGDVERRAGRAKLAAWSLPLYGVGLLVFAFAPNMVIGCIALVFIGAFFLASLSVGNNSIQLIVANRMRGRILALNVMVYTGSITVGAYLQSLLSDLTSARVAVATGGALLILVGLGLVLMRGRFSLMRLDDQFDSTPDPSPQQWS